MPNDESNHEFPEFSTSPGEDESRLEVPEDEILEYERMHRRSMGLRGMRGVLVALIVVGAGGVGWWVYSGSTGPDVQAELPVVHADATPFKERPESPGGLNVPDQDKLVYNRLSPDAPEPQPERLLAPPEEPIMPPQPGESVSDTPQPATMEDKPTAAPAKPETAAKAAPPASKPADKPAGAQTPTPLKSGAKSPPPQEKAAAAPPPARAAKSAPAKAPAPAAKAESASRPAPPPAAPAAKSTSAPRGSQVALAESYRVQLAAVRSEKAAAAEWGRLQKKYPDLLGNLRLGVTRADLGAKGVFYRLRAGPLPSLVAAKTLCADLSRKKVGCLVVSPGS